MTSANVTIYVIRDASGKEVGRHRQHHYCKTNWEGLTKFQPIAGHTIQWTWEDEHEAPHEKPPEPLVKFLKRIVKKEDEIEKRFPKIKAKREAAGIPVPKIRYLERKT